METSQLHNDALPLVQNKGIVPIHVFYLVDCHLRVKRGTTLLRNFQIRILLRGKMVQLLIWLA